MTKAPELPDDPLGLVITGLLCGVLIGVAFQALVAFTVRALQAGAAPATALDLSSAPAIVLLVGTPLAALAAAVTAWRVLSPLRHPWRQGVLSLVAAFGSFVLAAVTTRPVDGRLGRPGLLALAAVTFGLAWLLARRAAPAAS